MDEFEKDCTDEKINGKIDEWMSDIIKSVYSGTPGAVMRDAEKVGAAYHDSIGKQVDEAYKKLIKVLSEKYAETEAEDIMSCIEDYTDAACEMHFSLGLELGAVLYEKVKNSMKMKK